MGVSLHFLCVLSSWICVCAATRQVLTIGALFEESNFTEFSRNVQAATGLLNDTKGFRFDLRVVPIEVRNAYSNMSTISDIVASNNINVLLSVGHTKTLQAMQIIGTSIGIPTIGYSLSEIGILAQGEEDLYVQYDESDALLAKSVIQFLDTAGFRHLSIIVDKSYANCDHHDRFLETFRTQGESDLWSIEEVVRLNAYDSLDSIKLKLTKLHENKSKVIVVFLPLFLLKRLVAAAEYHNLFGLGYGWFIANHTLDFDNETMQMLPVGTIGIQRLAVPNFSDLIQDVVRLIATATEGLATDNNSIFQAIVERNVFCCNTSELEKQYAQLHFRSIINTLTTVGFDVYGSRNVSDFSIVNLKPTETEPKALVQVGEVRNGKAQLDTIVWFGNSLIAPTVNGKRRLRVVTNLVSPFVMAMRPFTHDNSCLTEVQCLKFKDSNMTDKDEIDQIFHDFRSRIVDPTRPYEIYCCSGLSISLLQQLSKDLNFEVELYIVADENYGAIVNGRWNGLVYDLMTGSADLAVAAFSITKSRLYVIDFSVHYFQSGYSILVRKKEAPTPINAIFEPFDIEEWLMIALSAVIAAIAMAVLEWNSPFGLSPNGRRRDKNYSLASSMNTVWAVLFGHTVKTKTPKSWPAKFLQNCWASASIFVIASYTANIASYIAGKNLPVSYIGINDPMLLEKSFNVAVYKGHAVNDFLTVKPALHQKLKYLNQMTDEKCSTQIPISMLTSGEIDAYLDDTPVLTYAKNTLDSKCVLRMAGRQFGADGYGLGFKKNSPLENEFSAMLLKYRYSGYIEDLRRQFFSAVPCVVPNKNRNELSFTIKHLAGIFVMISVGVIASLFLLTLEHVVFKYTIPYLRRKDPKSSWKSIKLMFFSQRMYRIVHSIELVSPNHSAKEMVTVLKKRQFEKLFTKETRSATVHKEAPPKSKGKLFDLSNQLIWLRRQQPASPQTKAITKSTESIAILSKATQTSSRESPEENFSEIFLHQLDSDNEYIEMDEIMKDWPENWETQFRRTEERQGADPDGFPYYKNDTFSLEDEENSCFSAARVGGGRELSGRKSTDPHEGPSETPNGRDSDIVISPRGGSIGTSTNSTETAPKRHRHKKLSSSSTLSGGKEKRAKSTLTKEKSAAIRNGILRRKEDKRTMDGVSKEDLVKMWRKAEYEYSKEIKRLKDEKDLLQIKLNALSELDAKEFTDCHWV
ncbi:glutamate receptor ionotropic, NMDA 3A-like [Lineus longissimus]|uniref:glutamate receptor ionotropic, NMDA 3A-like n=1 Tax=Lineus longissimus TaxID=88925 RepID=UPI00315C4C7B